MLMATIMYEQALVIYAELPFGVPPQPAAHRQSACLVRFFYKEMRNLNEWARLWPDMALSSYIESIGESCLRWGLLQYFV